MSVKCAVGSGPATSGTDGAYSVTISEGNLPCAIKAVGGSVVLHGVLAGTGTTGTFTANVSPLTELVVAKATGVDPEAFFSGFTGAAAPSSSAVAQAITAVTNMISGVVDLGGINPVSDALVAANGANPGDAHAQKIEALGAALTTAQTTVGAVAAAIVSNPATIDPVKTVLQPSATTCSWLRSGKYRMVNAAETDPAWRAHVLELDATTLTAKLWDNTTFVLNDLGDCKFSLDDGDFVDNFVVSSAGVIAVYTESKTTNQRWFIVGIPAQSLPASDWAGAWNLATWGYEGGVATPGYLAGTIVVQADATGQVTALSDCLGLDPCVAEAGPFPKFQPNAASGGFDLVEDGLTIGRAFLFKNLAGKLATVIVVGNGGTDGGLIIGALQQSLDLPAVGSASKYREFQLNGNGTGNSAGDQLNTVTAVDAAAKTVTRIRASDGRVDTLSFDKPRNGLRYRVKNSCTINGAPVNCSEVVQIPLQAMGITLTTSIGQTNAAAAFLNISVSRP